MNKNIKYMVLALTAISLSLGGCSNVKNSLGLEKESPDEFAVITRAPLEMPNNIVLPPPNLGAARPQEQATIDQAKTAIFGNYTEQKMPLSSAEIMLLQKANAQNANNNIRSIVNKETAELSNRNNPVAKKLLNIATSNDIPSATTVDAKKEYQRIKENIAEGKNITDGETPVIEE